MTHHNAKGAAATAVFALAVGMFIELPWWAALPAAFAVINFDTLVLDRTVISLCSECGTCKGWEGDV